MSSSVSATGFLCSPGQVTVVLDTHILPSLFGSAIPGRFHRWLEHVDILRRAVAVLDSWIQALSRFLSRVADVCV